MSFAIAMWIVALILFPGAITGLYILRVWSFPKRVASLIKTNQEDTYFVIVKCSDPTGHLDGSNVGSEIAKTWRYWIEVSDKKIGFDSPIMRGPATSLETVRWQKDKIKELCDSFRIDR
jgi:hypothetical protein